MKTDNNPGFRIPETYTHEVEVIASILADKTGMDTALRILNADMFNSKDTRDAWNAFVEMDNRGEEITLQTAYPKIDQELMEDKILKWDGSWTATAVYNAASALVAANTRRRAFLCGMQMIQASNGSGLERDMKAPAEDFIHFAEQTTRSEKAMHTLTDSINDLAEEIQETQKAVAAGERVRIPTSFEQLDYLTYGGFARGNLVIVAARPSVGKTAITLQMVRAAADAGLPSAVFSLEMTHTEISQRMVCSTGYVTARDIAQARVDWTNYEQAARRFNGSKVFIFDETYSLEDITVHLRNLVKQGRCRVAYIDYLGLMELPGGRSKYEQITDLTRRLKLLAKSLRIPIVLLCQLNRASVQDNRPPDLYDLRDSGSIEQDADIVLMLEWSRKYENCLSMFIRKNRQGPNGDEIVLEVKEGHTCFVEKLDFPEDEETKK